MLDTVSYLTRGDFEMTVCLVDGAVVEGHDFRSAVEIPETLPKVIPKRRPPSPIYFQLVSRFSLKADRKLVMNSLILLNRADLMGNLEIFRISPCILRVSNNLDASIDLMVGGDVLESGASVLISKPTLGLLSYAGEGRRFIIASKYHLHVKIAIIFDRNTAWGDY